MSSLVAVAGPDRDPPGHERHSNCHKANNPHEHCISTTTVTFSPSSSTTTETSSTTTTGDTTTTTLSAPTSVLVSTTLPETTTSLEVSSTSTPETTVPSSSTTTEIRSAPRATLTDPISTSGFPTVPPSTTTQPEESSTTVRSSEPTSSLPQTGSDLSTTSTEPADPPVEDDPLPIGVVATVSALTVLAGLAAVLAVTWVRLRNPPKYDDEEE